MPRQARQASGTGVKQYIKKMRKRDPELDARWGTICTPTRMQATDGKYYNTQAATIVRYSLYDETGTCPGGSRWFSVLQTF